MLAGAGRRRGDCRAARDLRITYVPAQVPSRPVIELNSCSCENRTRSELGAMEDATIHTPCLLQQYAAAKRIADLEAQIGAQSERIKLQDTMISCLWEDRIALREAHMASSEDKRQAVAQCASAVASRLLLVMRTPTLHDLLNGLMEMLKDAKCDEIYFGCDASKHCGAQELRQS